MSKVVGNTVGIPNPQPDWSQTDPTKADYIKNKEIVENMMNQRIQFINLGDETGGSSLPTQLLDEFTTLGIHHIEWTLNDFGTYRGLLIVGISDDERFYQTLIHSSGCCYTRYGTVEKTGGGEDGDYITVYTWTNWETHDNVKYISVNKVDENGYPNVDECTNIGLYYVDMYVNRAFLTHILTVSRKADLTIEQTLINSSGISTRSQSNGEWGKWSLASATQEYVDSKITLINNTITTINNNLSNKADKSYVEQGIKYIRSTPSDEDEFMPNLDEYTECGLYHVEYDIGAENGTGILLVDGTDDIGQTFIKYGGQTYTRSTYIGGDPDDEGYGVWSEWQLVSVSKRDFDNVKEQLETKQGTSNSLKTYQTDMDEIWIDLDGTNMYYKVIFDDAYTSILHINTYNLKLPEHTFYVYIDFYGWADVDLGATIPSFNLFMEVDEPNNGLIKPNLPVTWLDEPSIENPNTKNLFAFQTTDGGATWVANQCYSLEV